ncbi:MAG: thiamine pyrophosphate-binding protein [Dehalococcoidia bacterium]|nr:thiamine pyrophosphate-binding protein [Dehalococcoidia bacterium]
MTAPAVDRTAAATGPVRMKGQQFLSDLIRRSGSKAVFFVPTFLYPTLVELAEDPIKRVLCHSEKAAAYMADGYAQATNSPTIVITQGGPGAANLFAGLADAWQSHTPILAITPILPGSRYHGNSYQEVYTDFRSVTKYDAEVRTIDRMPEFFAKAYRHMTTGAPQPVHLYLEGALESMEWDFDFSYLDERYFSYPAFRPRAEDDGVQEAVRRLRAAERPVIVAGRGAIVSGAWNEVTQLAEALQIPVTTSLGGKGSIDERHPLALGVSGSYRRPSTDSAIHDADLVLYIGGHQGGATTMMKSMPQTSVDLIHVDINPVQPGFNYPGVLPLVGDARTVVGQMVEAAGQPEPGLHADWVARTQADLAAWREKENAHINDDATPIRPERLCAELVKACPDDALFVADTGYAAAWTGAFMDLPAGKNYIGCEGSLSWAFPAAIGAKAGAPERVVVAFTGDGGFWYHLGELETAVRNGINVITVVNNNHALVFDTHLLQAFWSASHDVDMLSEFRDVDFAAFARGVGAFGVRVTDPKDIGKAVQDAIASGLPAVIDVVVDHAAVAPVAFMAGQGSRGGMLGAPEKMK